MINPQEPGVNILMCWFAGQKTWGEGRTYQNVAECVSSFPEVRKVIMTFPHLHSQGRIKFPLNVTRVTSKLTHVTQYLEVVPSQGVAFELRKRINGFFVKYTFTSYLRFHGFRKENTLIWLFPPHPYMDSFVKTVPHSLLIGHIVDNFTQHGDPWLNRYAQKQYPLLQKKADVIIVGSHFNYDIFSQNRMGTYYFENAVDEDFLGLASETPVSKDGITRLGYVGTLSERTDFELLEHVARARADWQLLIAGKSEYSLSDIPCLRLPNVTYLGALPYDDLPSFMQGLDVCLIPHRNTAYSQSMSPLKLFQYLASGRPIVSSEIAGLEKAADFVRLATSPDDFVEAIDRALREDTLEMSARRIECAKNETWQKRVRGMFDAVMSHMPG